MAVGFMRIPSTRSCTPSVRGVLGRCAMLGRAGACESNRQTTPYLLASPGGRVGCTVLMVGSPSEGAWGWELARVDVSSTIADLKPERQAVLDWLRLARHQAVDSYLPDSDTVRDSCLDDVGACDLYVLILGHRYGFQPADGQSGRACRSRIWSSGGPVSAAFRGWRCCAPAFPTCGCRICRTRHGRRWCSRSGTRLPARCVRRSSATCRG